MWTSAGIRRLATVTRMQPVPILQEALLARVILGLVEQEQTVLVSLHLKFISCIILRNITQFYSLTHIYEFRLMK